MINAFAAATVVAGLTRFMLALSTGLAVATAWAGLVLAFYTDWPTSFWITAVSGLDYVAAALRRSRG